MTTQKIHLLSWNVNGIRAAARKGFSEWFNNYNAQVLCLQEVKATADQGLSALNLAPSIHVDWNDARSKAGYSGVATFSRIKPLNTENGFGDEELDREGRILVQEYATFFLYNLYFPNSQHSHARLPYKLQFNQAVLKHVQNKRKKGKAILICGDFNVAHKEIDLKNPKTNTDNPGFLPEERAWMDEILDAGFVDTFRHFDPSPEKYSWWSYRVNARARNIGWRIDYFLIDKEHLHMLADAFILNEVMGSDHCPVGIELRL